MVVDALLGILASLLSWLRSALPSWEVHLPAGVAGLIDTVLAYNDLLPITETMYVMGLSVTLLAAMVGFKWTKQVVDWIADILP